MNRYAVTVTLLLCLACGSSENQKRETSQTEKERSSKTNRKSKDTSLEALGIKMVTIPAGSFQMGSDNASTLRPVHTVTLEAFQMSVTEIIQAQYLAVMGNNPSYFTDNDDLPVERADWFNAVSFCNRLSRLAGLDSCYQATDELDYFGNKNQVCDYSKNGYRLPTEAEWEYACRAGTTTNYNTGDSESDLDRAGWYRNNCGHKTHQVAQKEPNAWGLYDMHGNVWEWTNDWYYQNYNNSSGSNPTGPKCGHDRVLRGGSWPDNAGYCRSANRCMIRPSYRNFGIGFRIVRRP